MKRIFQYPLVIMLAALLSGCATPYMRDRVNDAKDIVSIGIASGSGAKARASALSFGLLVEDNWSAGLRGGTFYVVENPEKCIENDPSPMVHDVQILFLGEEKFKTPDATLRNKSFRATSLLQGDAGMANWAYLLPPSCLADILPFPLSVTPRVPHYYTQLEVVAGLGLTLRVGFNPGELLDFILGWATIDIFNDDLEAKEQKDGPCCQDLHIAR
jgi:hypothetical protein